MSPTPRQWDGDLVSLRTTCIQRTFQTLQGLITGMYPELKGPVPVNASREQFEYEYGKNRTCPELGPILDKARVGKYGRGGGASEIVLISTLFVPPPEGPVQGQGSRCRQRQNQGPGQDDQVGRFSSWNMVTQIGTWLHKLLFILGLIPAVQIRTGPACGLRIRLGMAV